MNETDTKHFIKIADVLDRQGMLEEADFLDTFLTKQAKKGYHKCGLKESTFNAHKALLDDYKKASEHYHKAQARAFKGKDSGDSPNMGEIRENARGISHNDNAVLLHEMYMLDVCESKPFSFEKSENMKILVKEIYAGDKKSFIDDIYRMAKVPRNGWVILSYCFTTKQLHLDILDLHEIGVPAGSVPVMALDMWEHAYFADFGVDKEAYVTWFLGRMDWRNVVKRVRNYQRVK